MAGKYPQRKPARRITLSDNQYLTCSQGRWKLHKRVQIVQHGVKAPGWHEMPVMPQQARRLRQIDAYQPALL